jgi:flagellar basal body rod protein FlgG
MSDGSVVAASAMVGLQRQLDLCTKNLANLRTPGFHARIGSAKSFENALDESEQKLVKTEEAIAFEPGVIVQDSGNPLSVAIDGAGFFEVQTNEGSVYTRNGDFTLDTDGTLVTRSGYLVHGEGGPIRTTPGEGVVSIDAHGAVKQGETEIGRLRVFEFDDLRGLEPVSDTLYKPGRTATPRPVNEVSLKPESLEYAGETSVSSLVDMIKIHRQYDAAQRVMQSIADTYQQRIRSVT